MRALRTWNNDCYRLLAMLSGGAALDGAMVSGLAAKVLGPIERPSATLAALRDRLLREGVVGLTDAERATLTIELLLSRNKVTHIYELVKASGSTRQVEYERQARVWQRREMIAHKHDYETSVEPFSGTVVRGVEHAPLLYANDPRSDLPEELGERVRDVIRDRDPIVVAGWLAAAGR